MANSLAVLQMLALFLRCHSTTETLKLVSMSFNEELPKDHVAILVAWPNKFGGGGYV